MPPELEERMNRLARRILRTRANALRAEIYGVLEESRVGRGLNMGPVNPRSAPGDPPARQTGRLQESIRIVMMDEDNLVAHVGPDPKAFRGRPYYPGFLEYGTRNMAARPFMRVAVERFKRVIAEGGRPSDAP